MRNTDNEIDSERVSPDIDIESLSDNKASASPSSAQKQTRKDRKPKTKKNYKDEDDQGYNWYLNLEVFEFKWTKYYKFAQK